jgi:Na+/melibiose symporter-like transporter
MTVPAQSAAAFSHANSAAAGGLGLPLAFVALPLYVHLPHWYATHYGVPLAALGLVLLLSRLTDAVVDPWMGRLSDRLYARSASAVIWAALLCAVCLALGFTGLFFPPTLWAQPGQTDGLLLWAAAMLTLSHLAYSALAILHQSWAALLGGDALQRSRLVSWREGWGLLGVMLAGALPTLVGMDGTAGALACALALGLWAWLRSRRPVMHAATESPVLTLPWRFAAFRRLMTVFLINGVASAVPATLVLFFIQDQIQAPADMAPWFLTLYFVGGALSLPLWLACIRRVGLAPAWLCGMGLSVLTFAGVSLLGAGDTTGFAWACVLSGLALGADLAVPGALLNGLIDELGFRARAEGAFLGWWSLATKLNLALAAGTALPLLGLWGYAPGGQAPAALQALTWAYVVLPCVLKLCAAVALYVFFVRPRSPL